jgi:hypothetical protein
MKKSVMKDLAINLLVIILVLGMILLALTLQGLPARVPASAPASEFSSGRALDYIRVIAKQAHPVGSPAHDEARDSIVAALAEIGVTAELQKTSSVTQSDGAVLGADVQNLLARLYGNHNTKAILLVAHYDSVSNSPGASDNASGVAVILETLRALKSESSLGNDVIALFTDSEEFGLLGAKAFVEEHPWANDVGVVLNFDARGNHGSTLMFETIGQTGWLVSELAKVSEKPITSSLMPAVYRALQRNDTDLSVFREAGYNGLNFAHIEGAASYHGPLDTADKIDEGTIQNQGQLCLALTRHFGNVDLNPKSQSELVYFNGPGRSLVCYSSFWALPLFAVLLLAFVGLLILGFRRRRLQIKGIVLGSVAGLASAALSIGLSQILVWLAMSLGPRRMLSLAYESGLYHFAITVLTVTVTACFYMLFRNKAGAASMLVGAAFWWLLLGFWASWKMPAISYLFVWSLAFALPALVVMYLQPDQYPAWVKALAIVVLAMLPAIFLIAPVTRVILIGVGVFASGMVMGFVSLFATLLIPQLDAVSSLFAKARPSLLPIVGALVGFICITTVLDNHSYDKSQPLANNIFYVLDATKNKAVWASIDNSPDEFTSQFLSQTPERGGLNEYLPLLQGQYLRNPAPSLAATPPIIEMIDESRTQDFRTLHLRIRSSRQAPALSVYVDSGTTVVEATINGKRIEMTELSGQSGNWALNYCNPPRDGIDLILKVKLTGMLELSVVDQSYDLPQAPGLAFKPRPENMMAANFPLADSTLISKKFSF